MHALALTASLGAVFAIGIWLVGIRMGGTAANFRVAADAERELARTSELLLADDCVPEIVIAFVVRFSKASHRPKLARQFATDFVTGRLSRQAPPAPGSSAAALLAALKTMPTDRQAAFGSCIAAGLATSGFADVLFAPLHRRLITNFVSLTGRPDNSVSLERTRTVALDVSSHADFGLRGFALGS